MKQKISIRTTVISIIIGGIIVAFLLSKIDPRTIPHVVSKIPLQSLFISFMLYVIAVFLKAFRFRLILKTGISIKQLFPIVSLYMFFANILPMRTGELSYVYLLKKQARTPGTKGFASLIAGGVADFLLILVAMFIVGWHLRDALKIGIISFASALERKFEAIKQLAKSNNVMIITLVLLMIIIISGLAFVRLKIQNQNRFVSHIWRLVAAKVCEVGHELKDISFDMRLLAIIIFSILIISFRFATQWYLVRSMGVAIDIWELSFALLFGVLFSLIPIHGPAGLGTVEAPWVMALLILNVPQNDAIVSGFGLHIIIIMYCIILGIYGMLALRVRNPRIPKKGSCRHQADLCKLDV